MNKKEHLLRLLGIDRGHPSYAEMNTEIKSYNQFIKNLKVEEFDKEADKIYKKLHVEKSITAKNKGKKST